MRTCYKYGMSVSEFYESSPRDTYNFIRAGIEKIEFDIEQEYDYTRRMMWASIAAMGGGDKVKYSDLIRLKRDGLKQELTPFETQELKAWEEAMDAEVLNGN